MSAILLALDASLGSERALEAAVKLAQQDGGRMSAVTVLGRPADPHLERLAEAARGQAQLELQTLLQTAENFAHSRGVRLTPILREGHPAETIINCAAEQEASLVVLGVNSQADAAAGLGDTADLVSNHCPCTVLIVK